MRYRKKIKTFILCLRVLGRKLTELIQTMRTRKAILLSFACATVLTFNSCGPSSEELVKQYYPDGKLQSERHLKDGKFEGVTKRYYENGAIEAG
jgi:hypothetical protein